MKQSEIAQLLPGIFQRTLHAGGPSGGPLATLLNVMEALHAPSEAVLERVHAVFDPYETPDQFVPFLAGWLDLEQLLVQSAGQQTARTASPLISGLGRLRELIMAAAYLSQWRGTAQGLLRFLETATGYRGFEIDERVPGAGGQPMPFHLLVRAPAGTLPYQVLITRIIELEKPAYVTYDLEFGH
jgi:phage tail-like protein